MKKPKQPKKVSYQLIPETSDVGRPMYELLYRLVDDHHEVLAHANVRIALAWATSWKPDVDGRLILGKCKKASELDRELAPYDFVILLNKDFWQHVRVTQAQRTALLDHEICHGGVAFDTDGEPKVDDRGRTVFRTVKHDVEEFTAIIDRHGCYKADLEAFARALQRAEVRSSTWIGYSRLHDRLAAIGIDVPNEVIRTWSDEQRREVMTWALVRQETGVVANVVTSQSIPECLAAVVRDPSAPVPPTSPDVAPIH